MSHAATTPFSKVQWVRLEPVTCRLEIWCTYYKRKNENSNFNSEHENERIAL